MKTLFLCLIPLVIHFSDIVCLNKEVYEDSEDYDFDHKGIRNVTKKSGLNIKLSVVNSTGISLNDSQTKQSINKYDNYRDYQIFRDSDEMTKSTTKKEMTISHEKHNNQSMDHINRQTMNSTITTGTLSTSIRTTTTSTITPNTTIPSTSTTITHSSRMTTTSSHKTTLMATTIPTTISITTTINTSPKPSTTTTITPSFLPFTTRITPSPNPSTTMTMTPSPKTTQMIITIPSTTAISSIPTTKRKTGSSINNKSSIKGKTTARPQTTTKLIKINDNLKNISKPITTNITTTPAVIPVMTSKAFKKTSTNVRKVTKKIKIETTTEDVLKIKNVRKMGAQLLDDFQSEILTTTPISSLISITTTNHTSKRKPKLQPKRHAKTSTRSHKQTTRRPKLVIKLSELLKEGEEDDITLPPGLEKSVGHDLYIPPLGTELDSKGRLIKSPNLPIGPLPIFPIMPPKLPETPGFQTIWVPIQIRRDSHSINEMWKQSKTPNFIERGHIKHKPKLKEGTSNSWWRKVRPNYCFEPIVVEHYCADRQPLKKWSYNEADERCYRYIDYCSAHKLNSFDRLEDCLVSCWRASV